MLAHRHMCSPIQRRNQSGAVAMITVLFLLVVVGFTVLVSLTMSGSDVSDSTSQHNSVQALFLAESGLERTLRRYSSGTACDATLMEGPITFGAGTFSVVAPEAVAAPYLSAGACVVAAKGMVGNNARTIQASMIGGAGGAIARTADGSTNATNQSNANWNINIPAGTNRVLVVGVSIRNNASQTVSQVRYDGIALTRVGFLNNGTTARVEIWRLINPPTGNRQVDVIMSAAADFVGGAIALSGVDQTTPVEASNFVSGNSATASVTVATSSSGAWVVDTLAAPSNNSVAVGANQTRRWRGGPGTSTRGAGSTEVPATIGNVVMSWTITSQNWAMGAVALRPAGAASIVGWREIVRAN
jgi:hypothetical protein